MSNTRRSSRNTNARIDGLVIAVFGRHYLVETKDKITLDCVVRGKRSGVACGDQVEILPTTPGQGVIEKIKPRMTILHRSDAFREKIISANITQIIVVVAAIPSFSEELINRCLIAAESQCIKALIVLNKADMIVPTRSAAVTLSLYQELGYPLIQMSANKDISSLIPYLKGNVSVLAGQSGMGKSTLINTLIPKAERTIGEISAALDSGCHTTTHTHLYHFDANSQIIDTPGIQEFGIHHIENESLAWQFIEFRPYIGQCRFNNCRHGHEPDCAIKNATKEGKISERRLAFYQKLKNQPYKN